MVHNLSLSAVYFHHELTPILSAFTTSQLKSDYGFMHTSAVNYIHKRGREQALIFGHMTFSQSDALKSVL